MSKSQPNRPFIGMLLVCAVLLVGYFIPRTSAASNPDYSKMTPGQLLDVKLDLDAQVKKISVQSNTVCGIIQRTTDVVSCDPSVTPTVNSGTVQSTGSASDTLTQALDLK